MKENITIIDRETGKAIGRVQSIDSLMLKDPPKDWPIQEITSGKIEFSFDLSDESRNLLKKMMEEAEKSCLDDLVMYAKKCGCRGYYYMQKQFYKQASHYSHKHYGCNLSRYFKLRRSKVKGIYIFLGNNHKVKVR